MEIEPRCHLVLSEFLIDDFVNTGKPTPRDAARSEPH